MNSIGVAAAQRCDYGLAALLENDLRQGESLPEIVREAWVREHDALRDVRRAARVLQEGDANISRLAGYGQGRRKRSEIYA